MTPYDQNNVFARILRGELPSKEVFNNEYALAFHDLFPTAPVHVLVIPKGEFISFNDFVENATPEMFIGFFQAVREISRILEVDETGYRLVANHGVDGGQTVPHFHVHILGKRKLNARAG